MKLLEIATILAERQDRVKDISFILMLVDRIKIWRNAIIRNTIKANPNDIEYFLTYYERKLIKVNSFETEYDKGCVILKTEEPLRKSMRVSSYPYNITNIDGTFNLSKLTLDIGSSLKRKYSKDEPSYFVKNDYVYIYNSLSLNKIIIVDILEDVFSYQEESGCKIEDLDMMCPDDVCQKVISAILSELNIRDKSSEETINQQQ